jgi:hypothetical protein
MRANMNFLGKFTLARFIHHNFDGFDGHANLLQAVFMYCITLIKALFTIGAKGRTLDIWFSV